MRKRAPGLKLRTRCRALLLQVRAEAGASEQPHVSITPIDALRMDVQFCTGEETATTAQCASHNVTILEFISRIHTCPIDVTLFDTQKPA
jgi:hypothetical protein